MSTPIASTTNASTPSGAGTGKAYTANAEVGEMPTFGFAERTPTKAETEFLDDVLQLYQLHPVSSAYARYDQSATFHDPVGIAQGLNSVKAQFNAMPKIFSQSVTKSVKVLDNPEITAPSLQIALSQDYHFKGIGMTKLVNSKITYHCDKTSGLILTHDEEWDGQKSLTSADGFFGSLNELRKKATAAFVEAVTDTRPYDQQK